MQRFSIPLKCSLDSPAWDSSRYITPSHWGKAKARFLGWQLQNMLQIWKLPGFAGFWKILSVYRLYQCMHTVAPKSASLLPDESTSAGTRAAHAPYCHILWHQRRRCCAYGLEGCHSALQPRAWSGVRIKACVVCHKTYLPYGLGGVRVRWTHNAGNDAPFLTYPSISYGGQPLRGEIICNLSNLLKPLETMPSGQVHSYCSTWRGRE